MKKTTLPKLIYSTAWTRREQPMRMPRQVERHGMRHSREYKIWDGIVQRTSNPNSPKYANYGAKGIFMSEDWRMSFIAFYRDMGPVPSILHSIDRIDGSKGYYPDNCRWATPELQQRNRTFKNHPTGVNGVHKSKNGKYKVSIRVDGKQKHLGYFDDIYEAVKTRRKAELDYEYFS